MIDPGRKLAEFGIERSEVRIRPQECFLGEVSDVGRRTDARTDEIGDAALVAIDKHAERFTVPG